MKRFGELFSDTFNEYTKKFIPILKIFVLLYLIPLLVISILFFIFFAGIHPSLGFSILKTGNLDLRQVTLNQDAGTLALLFLGFFVFIIFSGIFYVLMSVSYIHIGLFKSEGFSFSKTFAFAKKNFWRYVRLILLTIICLIPLYILLIIPGIIFTVFWVFSSYILLTGKNTAWESMKQSKVLVKGRWWTIFGYVLLLFIMIIVTSVVLGFIPFVGNIVSSLVLTPFMVLFFKNFYLTIKSEKKS
jgi:hypothetical protein